VPRPDIACDEYRCFAADMAHPGTMRSAMAGSRRATFVLLAAGIPFVECRDPTEVTLEIRSDLGCDVLTRMGTSITVGRSPEEVETRAPGAVASDCAPTADGASVGTIVIVPSGGKRDHFDLRVTTGVRRTAEECAPQDDKAPDYSGCIVARRALGFLPSTPLRLTIDMRRDCVDQACDPTSTCVRGACVPSAIDPARCSPTCGDDVLAPPPPVDAGADAPADAASDCAIGKPFLSCPQITAGVACYYDGGASVGAGGLCSAPDPFCCNSPANGGVRCQPAECASPGEYTFACDESGDCPSGDLCIGNGHAGVDGGAFCAPIGLACSGVIVCQSDCDCLGGTCSAPHLCAIQGEAARIWIRTCGGVCP
jgi:hypothetical protein